LGSSILRREYETRVAHSPGAHEQHLDLDVAALAEDADDVLVDVASAETTR
jgi:hypothetical protein